MLVRATKNVHVKPFLQAIERGSFEAIEDDARMSRTASALSRNVVDVRSFERLFHQRGLAGACRSVHDELLAGSCQRAHNTAVCRHPLDVVLQ